MGKTFASVPREAPTISYRYYTGEFKDERFAGFNCGSAFAEDAWYAIDIGDCLVMKPAANNWAYHPNDFTIIRKRDINLAKDHHPADNTVHVFPEGGKGTVPIFDWDYRQDQWVQVERPFADIQDIIDGPQAVKPPLDEMEGG